MSRLGTAIILIVVLASVLPGAAWGQAQYTVTDLGILSGGKVSQASGVNNAGQVAGWADTPGGARHAFLYDGGMHDLGTLAIGSSSLATGINCSGQIVGCGDEDRGPLTLVHAFLASEGNLQDLGSLGGITSHAYGINDSGQVVGDSLTDNGGPVHAFLYSNGTMKDLGTLAFGTSSVATSINASGQIAGYGDQYLGPLIPLTHAFLMSGGSMQDIGTLGGIASYAYGINNSGQVVGDSLTSNGADHAFLYSGGSMQDLGTLSGGSSSFANGINVGGQIVGRADTSKGAYHAFLSSGGGPVTDLNSLIPPGTGWTLASAQGINAFGQIVGYGTNPSGQQHAFLLTPAFSIWASAVSGNWSDGGKWTGTVPNGIDARAAFNVSTTAAVTVTLDTPVTLGALQFSNSASTSFGYTLIGGGTRSLTLSNSGLPHAGGATIAVAGGTHAIDVPIILADDLVITSSGTNPWTLSFGTASSITQSGTGSRSLTMGGTGGNLILGGSNTYFGGTIVTAGLLEVTNPAALPDGSSLTINAGSQFVFSGTVGTANAVPEPSTLALLGLGAAALIANHRRRQKPAGSRRDTHAGQGSEGTALARPWV
jgi:probable HAF family extracellular repeat protein